MKLFAKTFLMVAVAAMSLSTFAAADSPGKHPAYLHALTDLRHARAFLYYSPSKRVDADTQKAIDEIEAAMHEITEAAIDDGKPMDEKPAADAKYDRTDRMTRAMELLDQARADVDKHESNSYVHGLKHRALKHIDEARKALKRAIEHQRSE